jgi:hypothetical protein
MTPALETLCALIAFYTLGFLWLVLPSPERATRTDDKQPPLT